jgi:hypothetical protein
MADIKFDDLLATIYQETSGSQALAYVRMIWEQDRFSNFASYANTARNVEQAFRQIGLADVQRVETPADGRHRVSDWVMPLAWDCADGRLEISSPQVPDPVLIRRLDQPNCVGMWSAATPRDGYEAEAVFLDKGDEEEVKARASQIKGRWVVTSERARVIKKAVADAGGIGIITCWTRNKTFSDVIEWVNGWSDRPGGWMYTATDTPLPCLVISRQMHARLRQLAAASGAVRLRGTIDARHYSGHLDYVTGRITGREQPDKEVLVLAHLYEQGANDNASGCATVLEMARTLSALIQAGRLPQPRRSIRFLLMAECYGSLAYAQDHRSQIADTIVCSCIDTWAGSVESAHAFYQINLAPLCSRSFYEAVHTRTVTAYLDRYRPLRGLRITPFGMGTDQEYNDPLLGVPTHWQDIGTENDLWHHSGDNLRTVDERAYVDLVCGEGATLYRIANADQTDAEQFARWTATYVKKEVLDRLAGGTTQGVLNVWREVGTRAVLSVRRLSDRTGPAEQLARQYEEFLDAECRIADCLSGSQAAEDSPGNEATQLIPARNNAIFGTLALDTIPVDQWAEGDVTASPRWGGPRTLSLWWADGKRSIAEIQERVVAETPLGDVNLVKWFRFLAKHGYVELHQRRQKTPD